MERIIGDFFFMKNCVVPQFLLFKDCHKECIEEATERCLTIGAATRYCQSWSRWGKAIISFYYLVSLCPGMGTSEWSPA